MEERPITTQRLAHAFARLEHSEHHIFAFFAHLGKDHVRVIPCDRLEDEDWCDGLDDPQVLSIGEFLKNPSIFEPEAMLSIFFDFRIDKKVGDMDEYEVEGFVELGFAKDIGMKNFKELFAYVLPFYCEERLLTNDPFVPSEDDIRRFGWDTEDVRKIRRMVKPLNKGALARLQDTFDRLKAIDWIKK